MKKHILLLTFISIGFLFCVNQDIYSQFERMEINYTVEEVVIDNTVTYNLTIKVEDKTGDIIISLYNDSPMPKNLIKESEPLSTDTYTFKNLPAGRYSVKIYESEKKGGFEAIDLGK